MALDLDATRLINAILKLTNKSNQPDTMIFGKVTSIDPLKIDIGHNIIIDDKHLFLSQMCRPHKVTIPHDHLINAFLTESTKAINTTSITAGTAVTIPQLTGQYDIKTQEIKRNDDEGTNERTLKTEKKVAVDLGGASLAMKIDVTGSKVDGASIPTGLPLIQGAVSTTTDLSTFTVTDNKHTHIVPEHKTQDVHFPGTDYKDSVEIEIYPRLKVDDKVLMFAFNNFQMYYVAERIEEE